MDPEQFQEVFKRLETEVQKVIVGHDDLIRKVLIAFFGGVLFLIVVLSCLV